MWLSIPSPAALHGPSLTSSRDLLSLAPRDIVGKQQTAALRKASTMQAPPPPPPPRRSCCSAGTQARGCLHGPTRQPTCLKAGQVLDPAVKGSPSTPFLACAAVAQRTGLGACACPCCQRAHAEGSRDSGGRPGHPDRSHRLHGGLLTGPGASGLLCGPGPATGGTFRACTLSLPGASCAQKGCTTCSPECCTAHELIRRVVAPSSGESRGLGACGAWACHSCWHADQGISHQL